MDYFYFIFFLKKKIWKSWIFFFWRIWKFWLMIFFFFFFLKNLEVLNSFKELKKFDWWFFLKNLEILNFWKKIDWWIFFFFGKIWKSWILSRNWKKNLIDDFFFFWEKFGNLELIDDFFFFFAACNPFGSQLASLNLTRQSKCRFLWQFQDFQLHDFRDFCQTMNLISDSKTWFSILGTKVDFHVGFFRVFKHFRHIIFTNHHSNIHSKKSLFLLSRDKEHGPHPPCFLWFMVWFSFCQETSSWVDWSLGQCL